MKTAISFFFISLVCVAHGSPVSQIIGGSNAPLGKYPHHVALKINGRFTCGGSIIDSRYILTAAHCINTITDPKNLVVHAGTIYLNETGDAYQAESVVWHDGFDDFKLNNDVGLIRLNRNIVYNNVVKPIPLAQKDIAVEDLLCNVSGWGVTKLGGSTPNTLQEITLKVYSPKKCQLENWRVTEKHICTFTKRGEGVCFGDSGSALLANGVQIGIASFVTPCALGYPDKFVKVFSFQDWIKKHMH